MSDEVKEVIIQRIYLKDTSLECPISPVIFDEKWNPKLNVDLDSYAKKLDKDSYNVDLKITVQVKSEEKTAFIIEVTQSGVFSISGLIEEELEHALGSFCPSTLYPYGREVITDLVMKAGFPQLILAPVNFEALYDSKKKSN